MNCLDLVLGVMGFEAVFVLFRGRAPVPVQGGHLRGLPQVLKQTELLQGGRALSISCTPHRGQGGVGVIGAEN